MRNLGLRNMFKQMIYFEYISYIWECDYIIRNLFSVKNKICNLGSQLNLNDEGIPNFKENVLSI